MAEAGPREPGAMARRLLPLALLAVAGAVLVIAAGGPDQLVERLLGDRDWLRGLVARLGFAAVVAYVLAYAGLMLALWIPAWLCTLIGGYLFGLWLGGAAALVGATLGATAVFALARRGLGGMAARAGPFVRRLEAGFRRNAFNYVLMLRLIPVVPFTAINLASALLGVSLRSFALSTVLGVLPSTAIYAGLGDALGALAESGLPEDFSMLSRPDLLWPLIGLALLALLPVLYRRWRNGPPPTTSAGGP
jgi:uncharacterized membrane protein YdjX (TVP38/TMEM64 family)